MENILNFTRKDLANWLDNNGIRPFRAGQIFKWLYIRQADEFEQMTDLSKELRLKLEDNFHIKRLIVEEKLVSVDKTEKFLLRLSDGNHIESVLIPQKDHFTLCVSSQVGCVQNCQFCLTAKGGLIRNLEISEIIAQIRDARYYLIQKDLDPKKLSNIVFMGMGEPLANYKNLIKALEIIMDSDYGLKFSSKRVTVSTCGLVPKITQLGLDTDVNLAISLNATSDEMRSSLMPINKKYPIKKLLEACRTFTMKPRKKITFEYILMKGINDTKEDAHKLAKLLAPIKAKINLIPFNEYDKSEFKRPSQKQVSEFLQVLLDQNFTAITRKSKGEDILAACGQLKAKLH
ncbi:MAG: 23S rRNA (adenine(2503)-C(2))-methyltransferase RlmN [Desulfobacula sp.]|jgi:23S rRNA (adenine2503-C2)-methyltransferase|uniref:23S rRNA (adenine(2503)-C(2))-methyltransferase RlmN n=1 Tax=Desulfobacula sp. TaxID=2593537 RepID=UPI001D57C9A6|nr:23S rRNA (adenine(2503)-C(2))-methyltransferase RlmN [Desulfobacula sp.]MBT3485219.1 23S rRNA (adenine(2503)-C(2))-methyltransferase RlmN [Desulfobacula sp.]MBT3804775.1 23S rRNA (adenine(2503)-C(2))-methyltransferase RlmN [Desulfobacula sp.]MBT4025252.1 23S rRNA (adenine(2503)-C(2))-methyltransferase RlmN [Desulfobacula sp.]MBT4200124.1 23S rRNA (adenine(2503)-C(2))-methyltransferase RlmN [Desulfobacula sp.]